jgi:PAS domain-containing protein
VKLKNAATRVGPNGGALRGVPAFERRILLLAPTGNDAKLTSHFLEGAGFIVEVCHSMDGVCTGVAEGCGSVLVAEETLGPRSMAALLETLEQQPSWSDVPVTIITGGSEVVKHRLRRLTAAGTGSNMGLLERPFHPETLVSTVGVAWRARQRQYQVRDLLRSQRESERRMVGILESISDAFISVDREWRFTYVNPTYMKLVENLFSSVDQLVGECLWEKFPDVRGTPVGDFYERTMAEQKPGVFEVYYGPVDRWLEVHAYPTPELLSLYMRDVTERRRHEAAMKAMHLQIEDQARLFDATLSHMADLAYTVDREGRFIYGNQKFLQVLGRTLDEVVGRNVFDLHYPAGLAERLHDRILSVIATGKPVKDEPSLYPRPENPRFMSIFLTRCSRMTGR